MIYEMRGDRWHIGGTLLLSLNGKPFKPRMASERLRDLAAFSADPATLAWRMVQIISSDNDLPLSYSTEASAAHPFGLSSDPDKADVIAALRTDAITTAICKALVDRRIEFTDAMMLSIFLRRPIFDVGGVSV